MEEIIVKVVAEEGVELPAYESPEAAGMDVKAHLKADLIIPPGGRALVPTGLRMQMPRNYECQVRPRSGLALNHGITVLNTPGTIDADSRAEIGVILINLSDQPFTARDGDRVAQIVFKKCERAKWEMVKELDRTKREDGAFGASGVTGD
ncbi:MAG: dUTP diphosphatase [Desulfovibrio sp.]|nr:dUTP diphosphatase [Desulfovibrio sp.]